MKRRNKKPETLPEILGDTKTKEKPKRKYTRRKRKYTRRQLPPRPLTVDEVREAMSGLVYLASVVKGFFDSPPPKKS